MGHSLSGMMGAGSWTLRGHVSMDGRNLFRLGANGPEIKVK